MIWWWVWITSALFLILIFQKVWSNLRSINNSLHKHVVWDSEDDVKLDHKWVRHWPWFNAGKAGKLEKRFLTPFHCDCVVGQDTDWFFYLHCCKNSRCEKFSLSLIQWRKKHSFCWIQMSSIVHCRSTCFVLHF